MSKRDWSRLEDSIHAAERRRIQLRTVAYRGDAAKTIASYVQLTKARLLVIGQHHGTSRWRRNTRIVQHAQPRCTCSRARSAATTPVREEQIAVVRSYRFGRRLYGHVRSSRANGTDLIRRTGARLTLVHALTNAPHHMVFSGGEALKVARNLRGQAAQVAERLRRKIPSNIRLRVDARVTTGDPHRGILEIASEVDADLIVMGVPLRTRFDEVLFGSTLRNVLRRTKIAVLVLPVLAGAYKWLEETDGVEVAVTARNLGRAKRLLTR